MKGLLFVVVSIILLFGFPSATNADTQGSDEQQVMKGLDDFQKALVNWMKNLDGMRAQFSTFQKEVGATLAPIKDFEKTMKMNEEKLNAMVSRLAGIEQATSVASVQIMLESFGKTLDVLKKLLSDITKRVEDQEVKTAVLEKRYQEAQRPLEPIKKAIEDLSKLVTDKLGEQEKKAATTEDSFKTRMASLDSTIKNFEGQLKTISDLETRIKKLEKGGVAGAGTATAEALPVSQVQASGGTETVKVAEGAVTAEIVKEHVPTPEEEGFKEIGEGFYVRNVNLFLFGSSSQIKGEILNSSERDRSIATFVIKVYNAADALLFTQEFSVKTFKKGEIRNFNEIISGYTPIEIARYEITPKKRY